MDYLGWELERQRAALAALLLGGRAAGESGEDGPEGPRKRETAVKGGLPGRRSAGPERPVSAWEGVCLAEGTGRGAETGAPAEVPDWKGSGPGEAEFRSGGTGAWRESEALPGGRGALETESWVVRPGRALLRERAAGRRLEDEEAARRVRAAEMLGGEAFAGGEALEEPVSEGDFAGGRVAGWGGGQTEAVRRDFYGGGGVGGSALLPEIREDGGAAPWRRAGGSPEARAEENARALSRAVQRDARRYDGGFTIA